MTNPEGNPIVALPETLAVTEPYRRAVQFARKLSVGVDYARFAFLWYGPELFGEKITFILRLFLQNHPTFRYMASSLLAGTYCNHTS